MAASLAEYCLLEKALNVRQFIWPLIGIGKNQRIGFRANLIPTQPLQPRSHSLLTSTHQPLG